MGGFILGAGITIGGTPSTQAHGDAAADGGSTAAADLLHKHAMPAAGGKAGISASVDSLGSGTLYVMHGSGSTTEADNEFICPFAGTLKNLYVRVEGQGSSLAATFTVRKNRVDTSITCTTPAASPGSANDTSNTASVVAGDRVSIEYVPGAAGNTGVKAALELEPS